MLISEIEHLPEPRLEEALRLIRQTFPQSGIPIATSEAKVTHPLNSYPELAGRILYDPTEPASEDEWPAASR